MNLHNPYRGSWHFVTSDIFVCLLENFAFVSSLFKFGGWRLLLRNVLFLKMVLSLSTLKMSDLLFVSRHILLGYVD